MLDNVLINSMIRLESSQNRVQSYYFSIENSHHEDFNFFVFLNY